MQNAECKKQFNLRSANYNLQVVTILATGAAKSAMAPKEMWMRRMMGRRDSIYNNVPIPVLEK